jgi:preprotein translocase SecE subunit
MNDKKWVNLSFFSTASLFSFLVYSLTSQVFEVLHWDAKIRNSDLILRGVSGFLGFLLFLFFLKSKKISLFTQEVFQELSHISWPASENVRSVTVFVIVMVLFSGFLLGLMDYGWSILIRQIL